MVRVEYSTVCEQKFPFRRISVFQQKTPVSLCQLLTTIRRFFSEETKEYHHTEHCIIALLVSFLPFAAVQVGTDPYHVFEEGLGFAHARHPPRFIDCTRAP